jgi:phosphonatase-like hydrolase
VDYDLVVFDIAGTTVYDGDAVGTCLREALRRVARLEFGRDEVNAVMGIAKPVAIARLLEGRLGRRPDECQVYEIHRDFEGRMLEHYRTSPQVREVEGAAAAFAALRGRGVKVALDTGFGRPITDAVLARLGWTVPDVVDATVTSDDVAAGRPAPDMIYEAMRLTGVADAARVVKVGDTPSDLHEGTNAGCGMVIGVTSGSHTADELRRHPHTALVGSVREVVGVVLGRAGRSFDSHTPSPLPSPGGRGR